MPNFTSILIMAIIFGGTALILYIIASFTFKNRILKAGKLELEPEQIKSLFQKIEFSTTAPLKWGLVLLCGGIGLIIINYLSFDATSTLPWGIEVVSLSVGYLLYYFALRKKEVTRGE